MFPLLLNQSSLNEENMTQPCESGLVSNHSHNLINVFMPITDAQLAAILLFFLALALPIALNFITVPEYAAVLLLVFGGAGAGILAALLS
jgi:hypothetical protein